MNIIAIIDDDPRALNNLQAYFQDEGFQVVTGRDEAGLRAVLTRHAVDLLLLDAHLAGTDGVSVTRELRTQSDMAIILINGRGETLDRLVALELGADDYFTAPLEPREVLARSRALLRRLRRVGQRPRDKRFLGYRLQMDVRRLLGPDGAPVHVTSAEFDLLTAFISNPGRVLTRDQLLDMTPRRNGSPFDRAVDTLVGRLRRLLGDSPRSPSIIVTVHGTGYMFTPVVE